jgi:hypothetical protein
MAGGMNLTARELGALSLYEFQCLQHGAALAGGAQEYVEPPSDAEHDEMVAAFHARRQALKDRGDGD